MNQQDKEVRVSVIIPAYNVEKYIEQCLESFLPEHDPSIEVICVDDGSTDRTLEILRSYESRDNRITVISQENAGAGAARNKGMQYARGEYLAFFDADDFFEPGVLACAYDKATEENSDIVVFACDDYLEETGGYRPIHYSIHTEQLPEHRPFAGAEIRDNFFEAFVGWPWDKIFRRHFVEAHQLSFQEQRTTNDALFVFSALLIADRISTMEEVFAHHRRVGSGKSLSVSREKSWSCFYSALLAIRDRLNEWKLYDRRERDFINYSLNFSIWHLNTLKGDAYHRLYRKLKDEWFKELGVLEKPEEFFYFRDKYESLQAVLSMDSEEYLHFLADQNQAIVDAQRLELERLYRQQGQTNQELQRTRRDLEQMKKKYTEIQKMKSYRIGRAITLPYRAIRDRLK